MVVVDDVVAFCSNNFSGQLLSSSSFLFIERANEENKLLKKYTQKILQSPTKAKAKRRVKLIDCKFEIYNMVITIVYCDLPTSRHLLGVLYSQSMDLA